MTVNHNLLQKGRLTMISIHGMTKKDAYNLARTIKHSKQPIKDSAFIAQPDLFHPFVLDTTSTYGTSSSNTNHFINLITISPQALLQNTTIKALAEYIYLSAREQHLETVAINEMYTGKYDFEIHGIGKNIIQQFKDTFHDATLAGDNAIKFTGTVAKLANSEVGQVWLEKWYPSIQIQISGPRAGSYFSDEGLPRACRTWILSLQNYWNSRKTK